MSLEERTVSLRAEEAEAVASIGDDDIRGSAVRSSLTRELRRLFVLLAVAAGIFALLYLTPVGAVARDVQSLRSYLTGDDLWAEFTFMAMTTALVAIGAPRLVLFGIGGLAFGFWLGLLLAQFGSVLGSYLTFTVIRHGGRAWLQKRFAQSGLLGRAFRVRSSIRAVVLIRQLPLHGMLITSGLALSKVGTRAFLAGTFIGYLPQGALTALITSGVVGAEAAQGLSSLAIAAVALICGYGLLHLWKRHTAGNGT